MNKILWKSNNFTDMGGCLMHQIEAFLNKHQIRDFKIVSISKTYLEIVYCEPYEDPAQPESEDGYQALNFSPHPFFTHADVPKGEFWLVEKTDSINQVPKVHKIKFDDEAEPQECDECEWIQEVKTSLTDGKGRPINLSTKQCCVKCHKAYQPQEYKRIITGDYDAQKDIIDEIDNIYDAVNKVAKEMRKTNVTNR